MIGFPVGFGPKLCLAMLGLLSVVCPTQRGAAQARTGFSGEGIEVCENVGRAGCTSVALNRTSAVPRGTTSRVTVVKAFIDQFDPQNAGSHITVTSPATVRFTSKGAHPQVSPPLCCGYVTMEVTVPGSAGLIPLVLKIGDTVVPLQVVRKGLITVVEQEPDPAQWAANVAVTVRGEDIGNAAVSVPGHATTITSSSDDELRFNARATGNPPGMSATTGGFRTGFRVRDGSRSQPEYEGSSVDVPSLRYRAPSSSAGCVSMPSITAPTPTSPADGAVHTNIPGDRLALDLRWSPAAASPGAEPLSNQQYIVELTRVAPQSPARVAPSGATPLSSVTPGSTTALRSYTSVDTTSAGATVVRKTVDKGFTYRWRVRALNCGQPAPFSPLVSFTVQ